MLVVMRHDATPDQVQGVIDVMDEVGIEEYISGVILYDETIRQSTADGTPFPKMLESRGILPGIKAATFEVRTPGVVGTRTIPLALMVHSGLTMSRSQ